MPSTRTTTFGPWTGVFDDGPCEGEDNSRMFICQDVYDDLWLIPHPSPEIEGHIIVGYGEEPETPWDGQVHYHLYSTEDLFELVEMVAHYRLAEDA